MAVPKERTTTRTSQGRRGRLELFPESDAGSSSKGEMRMSSS